MDINKLHLTQNRTFNMGLFLLMLAIFDSFFSDYGIRNHYITEANPIMRLVYDTSIIGFYAIKISLPVVFLLVITKIEPKKYLQIITGFTLLLYTFILFLHISWISILLS